MGRIYLVLLEEIFQLVIQPLHILRVISWTSSPMAPYRWEWNAFSNPGIHVRDLDLGILRCCVD